MTMPDSNAPQLGQGDVTFELCGEPQTLKPTLGAIQTLSRKYGGMQNVLDRLSRLDFDAVIDVVEVGTGAKNSIKARQELAEKIYATGITDDTGRLVEYCIDYMMVLCRGGRPAPKSAPNGADDTEGN